MIHHCPFMTFKKVMTTPAMKPRQKRDRMEWALDKLDWGVAGWSDLVCYDEKKFNLDEPDDLAVKWQDK